MAAVHDRDYDVLLSAVHVGHGRAGGVGGQVGFPNDRAGGLVLGAELSAAAVPAR